MILAQKITVREVIVGGGSTKGGREYVWWKRL